MGSRIMHLVIAKGIAQAFQIDPLPFAYGNLLVDAHHKTKGSKAKTHFVIPHVPLENNRYLDHALFFEKYKGYMADDVVLGYYAHLVSDDIWLDRVYVPTMLDVDRKRIQHKQAHYYDDFAKLNIRLIEKHHLQHHLKAYQHPIKEVVKSREKQLLTGLAHDFSRSINGELMVLDEGLIDDYIRQATHVMIEMIEDKKLRIRRKK